MYSSPRLSAFLGGRLRKVASDLLAGAAVLNTWGALRKLDADLGTTVSMERTEFGPCFLDAHASLA